MSRLDIDRANRNAARDVFVARLTGIKADLEARSVGARVADTVKDGTADAIGAGLDVARERKGLLAGTIGALLLWIFRHPLLSAGAALIARLRGEDDEIDEEDEEEPA